MSAVLKHIAAIAKGLSKAELHVLIELASRAEEVGENDAVASSRELAGQTGLARSSVQISIDSLNSKGVILSSAGTATRSAMHRLLFLDAVEIRLGGPIFRPEVARESGQGGLDSAPLRNGKSTTCEPAHIENASAPAGSIEKSDFDRLIDRIQNAKKADFDDEVFEAARNLIASHHAKFAREGCQLPGKPDDQITAQFLAVADWPRLNHMLHDLLTERQSTSFSWAWYVTVALQRIHGISPDEVRGVRANLRNSSRHIAPPTTRSKPTVLCRNASAAPTDERLHSYEQRLRQAADMNGFGNQLRALVARKSMK